MSIKYERNFNPLSGDPVKPLDPQGTLFRTHYDKKPFEISFQLGCRIQAQKEVGTVLLPAKRWAETVMTHLQRPHQPFGQQFGSLSLSYIPARLHKGMQLWRDTFSRIIKTVDQDQESS